MTNIKVGDRVVIRTWGSMKNEFGLRDWRGERAISCSDRTVFIPAMKYMSGNSYRVSSLLGEGSFFVGEVFTLLPEMVVGFQP